MKGNGGHKIGIARKLKHYYTQWLKETIDFESIFLLTKGDRLMVNGKGIEIDKIDGVY